MLPRNKIEVLWTEEEARNGYRPDSQHCLPQTDLGGKHQEYWFRCGKFQNISIRMSIRLVGMYVWNSKEKFELHVLFFFKFSILFTMCWVVEGTSDLRNFWEYTWESKRGTKTIRALGNISGFSFTTWRRDQPHSPSENSWEGRRERTYGPAVANHQSHQPSCLGTFKRRVFNWKDLNLIKGPGYPWECERSETRIKILDKGEYKKTLPS